MSTESRKVAIVTGASRGIGAAIATAFVERGATVALVARGAEALDELAGRLGGTAPPADLTDSGVVAGLLDRVEAEAGPVDVLVNNAGMEPTKAVWSMSATEVEAILRLNLVTPAELTRQAAVRFRPRGRGHIVNVSSLAGCVALPASRCTGRRRQGSRTSPPACAAISSAAASARPWSRSARCAPSCSTRCWSTPRRPRRTAA